LLSDDPADAFSQASAIMPWGRATPRRSRGDAVMSPDPKPEPRNLVVCCDGTSNEIVGNITNVLKLYRIATKDDGQRMFYDPGVGTISQLPGWGRGWQKFKEFMGLATGFGLDDNILRAYNWLCEQYRPGDRIFLFGFSRGAYTVRAIAGLMHMIGLLAHDQRHLAGFALTAYKRAAEKDDLTIAWQFARLTSAIDAPIHFLGVWDTVASVIVPRPDRLYLPSLQFLPYTKQSDRVRIFRQAFAIDERRAMFRNYNWNAGQGFKSSRFAKRSVAQDERQVWFAGVHADIGGGYAEAQSGLAKFPLRWMLDEAQAAGLRISDTMRRHLVEGNKVPGGQMSYARPDATAPLHRSLKGLWWPLEFWPKKTKYRRWPGRWGLFGFYLPLAEPRLIPDGANVHESAVERHDKDPDYRPVNWPSQFVVERTTPGPPKTPRRKQPSRRPKTP
jgi:uncharacterized protein (DUF2235 family)